LDSNDEPLLSRLETDRIWGSPSDMELFDILVVLHDRELDPEQLTRAPMGLVRRRAIQEIL